MVRRLDGPELSIVIKVEVETLMVELTTRPKAELLMSQSIKAEAEVLMHN